MHSDVLLCICNVHKDKSLRRKLSPKTKKKCVLIRYSDAHKGNNYSSSIGKILILVWRHMIFDESQFQTGSKSWGSSPCGIKSA